ncbi:hypothetical protein [Streptomyces sp. NPDC102347]|uniref:hypothetical protein n=1 Tax=Streptomyces sp. NPDC102347 TaxID=3366157 RepID=UPI003827F3B5
MSDELRGALRELASRHERPPRLAAAEVRDRARRRSRRRRAVLALGTAATAACAATVVALTLHTEPPGGTRHRPGATPAVSPPAVRSPSVAAPSRAPRPSAGRLDLGLRTLTLADRVLRVDTRASGRFPPGTRLTVIARTDGGVLPLRTTRTTVQSVKVPYLVQLRTPDGERVYAGPLSFDARLLRALSGTTGWVGMSLADAEWFHDRVRTGDEIELASAADSGGGGATGAGPAPTQSADHLGTSRSAGRTPLARGDGQVAERAHD